MNRIARFLVVTGLALGVGVAAHAGSKMITVKQVSELSFKSSSPGAERAVLWGNPEKGEWGGISRRMPGVAEPWHTHSHDLRLVVLTGTAHIEGTAEGSRELSPSSFVDIPAYVRHRAICGAQQECTWLVVQSGRFDMLPEGSASVKAVEKDPFSEDSYQPGGG